MDTGINMLGQFQGDSSLGLGSFQGNSYPSLGFLNCDDQSASNKGLQIRKSGFFEDYDKKDAGEVGDIWEHIGEDMPEEEFRRRLPEFQRAFKE